jgi:hypothetical protein
MRNLLLRFGLTIFTIGTLALVLLLAYNHGLEDTFPLTLYLIAWFAIPTGLLLCLIGALIKFVRRRLDLY